MGKLYELVVDDQRYEHYLCDRHLESARHAHEDAVVSNNAGSGGGFVCWDDCTDRGYGACAVCQYMPGLATMTILGSFYRRVGTPRGDVDRDDMESVAFDPGNRFNVRILEVTPATVHVQFVTGFDSEAAYCLNIPRCCVSWEGDVPLATS